jgi:hypothetical protein
MGRAFHLFYDYASAGPNDIFSLGFFFYCFGSIEIRVYIAQNAVQ